MKRCVGSLRYMLIDWAEDNTWWLLHKGTGPIHKSWNSKLFRSSYTSSVQCCSFLVTLGCKIFVTWIELKQFAKILVHVVFFSFFFFSSSFIQSSTLLSLCLPSFLSFYFFFFSHIHLSVWDSFQVFLRHCHCCCHCISLSLFSFYLKSFFYCWSHMIISHQQCHWCCCVFTSFFFVSCSSSYFSLSFSFATVIEGKIKSKFLQMCGFKGNKKSKCSDDSHSSAKLKKLC